MERQNIDQQAPMPDGELWWEVLIASREFDSWSLVSEAKPR